MIEHGIKSRIADESTEDLAGRRNPRHLRLGSPFGRADEQSFPQLMRSFEELSLLQARLPRERFRIGRHIELGNDFCELRQPAALPQIEDLIETARRENVVNEVGRRSANSPSVNLPARSDIEAAPNAFDAAQGRQRSQTPAPIGDAYPAI